MKKLICLLLLNLIVIGCDNKKGISDLTPAEFSQKIESVENPQILDVRTPGEFAGDHLDGAQNVDWNADDFEQKAMAFDKSEPVFVYCKSGGRSASAAQKLQEMGFKEVYNMEGGIMKRNAEGLKNAESPATGMTESDFNNIVAAEGKVLVNFSAEWCPPCKKMKPYLQKMEQEMKDEVKIVRLDADVNKSLVAEMKIDALPTLRLYQDGEMIWEHKGFISESELKAKL